MEDVAAGKLLVDGVLGHLRHADGAEVVKGCKLLAGGGREDRVQVVDDPREELKEGSNQEEEEEAEEALEMLEMQEEVS